MQDSDACRWIVQVVSGCLPWLLTSHASDFYIWVYDFYFIQGLSAICTFSRTSIKMFSVYRRPRERADRRIWFEPSSCRRKALGSTGGEFDKCGENAVPHGTGVPVQSIQPRFYDIRTTRRLVDITSTSWYIIPPEGIRLYCVPACYAQS